MSEDQSLAQRMHFIKLDEHGKAAIRSLKPLIDKELPAILDSFYIRIGEFPEVSRFFSDAGRAGQAKNAQLRHWARISSADFNQEYLHSVRTIGQTHARIGLDPRWYIGGYALITEQIIAAALTTLWPRGLLKGKGAKSEGVAAALGAVVKAVLLDMDFAISTYIEAAEEGRRRAEEASAAAAKQAEEASAAAAKQAEESRAAAAKQAEEARAAAAKQAEEASAAAAKQAEEVRATAEEVRAAAAKQQAAVVESLTRGLDRLAKGDLAYRSTEELAPEYQKVQDDFNAAMAQLQQTIQAIAVATREVASASAEISSGTTDLSQRTEEQAASLEETSASMEQISTIVKKNADNAQQANQFASSTREVADRGGAVVAQAVSAMARIEDSSGKISDIISIIDEIARQTNLLALNAAVEAARAGEAGRGFAVVASEVRSLAQRSSQAAKDIKDLITNSTGQVKEGVELVNKTGASLTEILGSIKKVAEIVSDIAAASAEQSSGIDQVNIALTQMDEVTQQNSALVEQNAAAAKSLEQQSQAMDERVSFFQLGEGVGDAAPPAAVAGRPAAKLAPRLRPAAAAKRPAAVAAAGSARRMQTALAAAVKEDASWKEF
jgi:methyl-accepting chemotaxis protein